MRKKGFKHSEETKLKIKLGGKGISRKFAGNYICDRKEMHVVPFGVKCPYLHERNII